MIKNFFTYASLKVLRKGRRRNRLPGRGGAPKFLKNWLPFAPSPYDPDHIFSAAQGATHCRTSLSMAPPLWSLFVAWDNYILKQSKQRIHMT